MKRKHTFIEGEYYHIYNRGVDKRDIFLDDSDYKRFLILLYICNSCEKLPDHYFDNKDKTISEWFSGRSKNTFVDIGGYCLMPNHFHLIVRSGGAGSVSSFLKKLCTAYAMFFNAKYNRSGILFQGRFRSKHVDEDEYLKYIFSYIHLNPLELYDTDWKTRGVKDVALSKKYLYTYPFSSLLDMDSKKPRPQNSIINRNTFPRYFNSGKEVSDHIDDFLNTIR